MSEMPARGERAGGAPVGILPDAPAADGARVRWPSQQQLAIGALTGLVILAVALRLVPVVIAPSLNWWDEVFQAIEPAHRLVYGYGLVPWEFQLGMRSWLLPGAVAAAMELARLAGDGPAYYLPAIAIAFGLLAAAPVVCCFLWCRRWYGLAAACVAAFVVAVAPELVYFGARTLSEVVAAHLLVVAFYLIEPGYRVGARRRLVAAGILFGVVCLLRIHLAPAVAVILLWSAARDWRWRLYPLIGGGLIALAGGAALDWLTLNAPLASVWRNLLYNVFLGVSADFTTGPWYYYLADELGIWQGAAPFALLLVALGARRLPVLLAAAVVVIAVHSGIAHKEYRFIYPAVVLLMILAAVGLAELAHWAEQALTRRGMRLRPARALCLLLLSFVWTELAIGAWSGGAMAALRQRDHDELQAVAYVRDLPSPCGIGLYGERAWVLYGGYSWLHRPIPMFWPEDEAALVAAAGAFDTLIYRAEPPPPLGFARLRCFGEVCVARRPGGCAARAMPAMWFPPQLRAIAPPTGKFEALPQRMRAAGSPRE